MKQASVQSLHVYPIKSCGGVSLKELIVDEIGPRWDRRWMFVDRDGVFLTQRKHPKMALIECAIRGDRVQVTVPGENPFSLREKDPCDSLLEVRVWKDTLSAELVSQKLSKAVSAFLGVDCRLVRMDPLEPRLRKKEHEFKVSFADSRPFLLCSAESLAELNKHSELSVPMDRFRANIVIHGAQPYAEDTWQNFSVGDIAIKESVECDRCSITTVDQKTAQRSSKEPLKALAKTRRGANGVVFGRRLTHKNSGLIRVGDPVTL